MKTLVCTAQDFGFGPVSKLLAITENFQNIRKIFFGTGVALDLAQLHPFDEIHECGHADYEKIRAILKRGNLVLNVMDFPLTSLVKSVGRPYFLVDSLLWFWPKLPDGVEQADRYFCQNFFGSGVKERVKFLRNAQLIGPIMNTNFRRSAKTDQVIINFGGLENPYIRIGENSNYPFIILSILLPILQQRFSQILVTGRERVLQLCRERFPEAKHCQFKNLSPREMLTELYRSQAVFTTPGIQTFYDAADKVPIFCLLPQNDSNIRNLRVLVEHQVIKHYLAWEEIAKFPIDQCPDIAAIFTLLQEKIAQLEIDQEQQKVLQTRVQAFLEARSTWSDLVNRQRQAVESLGDNGTQTILQAIQRVLYPLARIAEYDPSFFDRVFFSQKI